jgi:hypothetical protein
MSNGNFARLVVLKNVGSITDKGGTNARAVSPAGNIPPKGSFFGSTLIRQE